MIQSVTRYVCLALTLLLCACGVSSTPPSTYSHETATANLPDAPPTEARESGDGGRHRHRRRGPRGGRDSQAGKFDFYVLSLSWSPGFCATPAGETDSLQCGPGRHFAFVLHGLWPQYERGGWPENCSTEAADESLVRSMLTIMPSPKLVAHEWEKHGTCSGLSSQEYFEEATEAFHSVKIPAQYEALRRQVAVNPNQMQHDYAAANPKIGDSGFVVLCSGNGRYLQEVRVCLTEDLEGRRCNAAVVHDACKSGRIIMRPVR